MRKETDKILLAHGGGGSLTDSFIKDHLLSELENPILRQLNDAASLSFQTDNIHFTTDSFVVKPLFFNGGDIGKMAVCGTANDLSVSGAIPEYLSLSLIIEEGFELHQLDKIIRSISRTCKQAGIQIVTGDTKTVEKGSADGIFINTSGIGSKHPNAKMGYGMIQPGDHIIINGPIGNHGMTLICQREGIQLDTVLKSDCTALNDVIFELLQKVQQIKFMRDPTRGGVAMVLNEIAENTGLDIEIYEDQLPVDKEVQAAADVLGFDLLNIANEGKFITVVPQEKAEDFLSICRHYEHSQKATVIGVIKDCMEIPAVEMVTKIGGRRIVQKPYGRDLPRIC